MLNRIYNRLGERWVVLLVIFIFSIFFYFDILVIERFKIFLFIFFFIGLFIEILNYVDDLLMRNLKKKEEEIANVNIRYFISFVKRQDFYTLLSIYYYKNIVLVFLIESEMKLFFWFRRLNLFFINYLWISKTIYWIIMGLVILPTKFILGFYYVTITKFKKDTIAKLFFKRVDGLIISLVFTTNFIYYFMYCFKYLLVFLGLNENYIIFYLLLLFYFIILFIIFIFNFVEDLSMKSSFPYNSYTNLNIINAYRIDVSLVGVVVKNLLNYYILVDRKLEMNNKFIVLWYYTIHDLKLYKVCDEFLYYKLENKAGLLTIVNSDERMFWEFKNKPFMNLYEYELNRQIFCNFNFRDIIWGLKKYEGNEEITKELIKYLKEEEELFKYHVYKLWDIERYLGYTENCVSALYYYTDREVYNEDYGNLKMKVLDDDLVNNLKKNKEIFLDLEDNFDLYVNIWMKLDRSRSYRIRRESYFKFKKENKIDYIDLLEYDENLTFLKNEEGKIIDFTRYYDNKRLMPILREMEGNVKRYRVEWEREWEEGKRSYIWKE